jgi:hypothetical protein
MWTRGCPRKQTCWTTTAVNPLYEGQPFLNSAPKFIRHDAQFWPLGHNPLFGWPRPLNALVRARFLHETAAVPDYSPQIEFTPEHLAYGGGAPGSCYFLLLVRFPREYNPPLTFERFGTQSTLQARSLQA